MGARYGNSPMPLVLAAGQVQRVLVEGGSTLVIMQGVLTVRYPFAWLAQNIVALEARLAAEGAHCFREGGWVDLVASRDVEAMILPPETAGLWAALGRYLGRLPRIQNPVAADRGEVPSGKVSSIKGFS